MRKYSESAREARNAYARDWRRRNRDKVAATNARYWEKVAARTEPNGNDSEQQHREDAPQ